MTEKEFKKIKRKILNILRNSTIEEEVPHAKNTLKWVLKLKPDADFPLKIAALGHDIERGFPELKIKGENYKDYDAFKEAHSKKSAEIIYKILSEFDITEEEKKRVAYLVRNHETGKGDEDCQILNIADALSFFECNVYFYYKRNGYEKTKERCIWGLKRLPESYKNYIKIFHYKEESLNKLINSLLG